MFNNKAYILISVLGFILVFMILGAAVTQMVTADTNLQSNLKHSKQALAYAEAGIQRGIAILRVNNNPDPISSQFYQVAFTKISSNQFIEIWRINSIGTFKDSTFSIDAKIEVQRNIKFHPFAADGKFKVKKIQIPNSFDNMTEIYAREGFNIGSATGIDNDILETINNLNQGEDQEVSQWNLRFVHDSVITPSVKRVSVDFDPSLCDVGDSGFSSNIKISDLSLSDENNDDVIVVCGNQVTIDTKIYVSTKKFLIFANDNIEVNQKIDEHGNNSVFEVGLFAKNNVIFNDRAEIEHNGKADTYNITVYAENKIISNTDHFIHVTGFSTSEQKANILLASANGIEAPDANIHYTGKESNNLLIWSDGDIVLGKWHATGSGTGRKVAIIAHSDDPSHDPSDIEFREKIHITGSHEMEGLSVDDIQQWYDQLDDDDPVKEILRGMLAQLAQSADNNKADIKKICWWRVE